MIGGHPIASDGRYVAVVADDFGSSPSVNEAVAFACDRGFLTAASIVAGGDAFEEAIDIAGRHPRLSVGLHVTLSGGRPVLPPVDIPDLVNGDGSFDRNPMRAGISYWASRAGVAVQLEAEVRAQFDKLEKAGIRPTHADCHHHLHMHPVIFPIIAREAARRGAGWVRIPREPLSVALGLRGVPPNRKVLLTWLAFRLLTGRALKTAYSCGLQVADHVYGLSATGRMNEGYLLALLPQITDGVSEIYLHPDLASSQGREETKAAASRSVRDRMKALGLQLVGFGEVREIAHHPRKDPIAHVIR
jgi:hopanoid biosynthesis associated protein HpnK